MGAESRAGYEELTISLPDFLVQAVKDSGGDAWVAMAIAEQLAYQGDSRGGKYLDGNWETPLKQAMKSA
ncbi:MAG: hypothetical protein AAF974_01875 [Cyanobacteria bacterium P01_E01_bin.34]